MKEKKTASGNFYGGRLNVPWRLVSHYSPTPHPQAGRRAFELTRTPVAPASLARWSHQGNPGAQEQDPSSLPPLWSLKLPRMEGRPRFSGAVFWQRPALLKN